MVYGEDRSSSSRIDAISVGNGQSPHMGKPSARFITIGELIDASRTNRAHLSRDVHPDADLARIVGDRSKKFATEKYELWTEGLVRIALGAALMSAAKEINAQGQVRFLHLAQGGNAMRSHDGNTFLYENGAFRLFK